MSLYKIAVVAGSLRKDSFLRNEPVWSSDYFGGLRMITGAITERLEKAGAKLGAGCLTHPVVSRVDAHPPAKVAITVVPLNGPRLGVVFTDQDFLRSIVATDPQASAKVDLYVEGFRKFREDGIRHIRGDRRHDSNQPPLS